MKRPLIWAQFALACPVFLAISAINPACAGDTPTQPSFWSISVENDLFASGDDGHYTSGLNASHLTSHIPHWLAGTVNRTRCAPCRNIKAVEYVFGQDIFTPEDVSMAGLQINDRPYAGWLYAGIGAFANRETARPDVRSYDKFELTLGMVGPASLAGRTQKAFHRITGSTHPRGWDNQLDNEPGIVLAWTRRWQNFRPSRRFNGLEHDLSPHVVGALGNIYTYAGAGAIWRFGKRLRADAGPQTLRPGFTGAIDFSPGQMTGWYVFAGFEARAMARNIFLDGNTFTDSHSVHKKPVVADLQFGFAFTWKSARLTFSEVFRSREFDGQHGNDEYGSISLTFSL